MVGTTSINIVMRDETQSLDRDLVGGEGEPRELRLARYALHAIRIMQDSLC